MNESELQRALERIEIPGEHESRGRAWETVSAAYRAREPVSWPRRRLVPLIAAAAVAAVVGAALTPPGRAVLDELREAIGVEHAEPALFSLPAPGRLLVESDAGPWVVQPDGSKRLLAGYREASWSPTGLFVVATRRNELAALEPDGTVRWSLARPDVSGARWGGTRVDTRIAYLSGTTLRVVAGDGTGDRALVRAPDLRRSSLAWRPGPLHVLAYATQGVLRVVDADARGEELWSARVERPVALVWSARGDRLVALSTRSVTTFDAEGKRISRTTLPRGASGVDAALAPDGRLAVVFRTGDRSVLRVGARRVFAGPGRFTAVEWSPDGTWLLLAWVEADQWLFVRPGNARQVEAVADVSRQFGGSFPRVEGWCCS